MERVVNDHWKAIDNKPGRGQVKLVVDEWGAWYGKGTELAPQYNLSQQSTMRDALLTGITLDIFQRNADKVAVANVAQSINCIHSLMLAQEDKFTVTPTFHVFQMYLPHSGGQAVRAEFTAPTITNPLAGAPIPVGGNSYIGSLDAVKILAGISGSASIAETGNGKLLTLSVVNPHIDRPLTTEVAVRGASIASAKGTVLASRDIHDHNDFAHPDAVKPAAATTGSPTGGKLLHTFPPASVTTLQLTLA
jgi:alpha-N-arabinofuranosidase